MIRKLAINVGLLAVAMSVAFPQAVEYTRRSKNEVRDGPGNYFRLLAVLPQGVTIPIIKRQEGWVNFRVDEKKRQQGSLAAWMSKNCLLEKKPNTVLKDLQIEWNSPKASASSIAAAIRGFAVRYGKTKPPAVDSLLNARTDIDPAEYLRFKEDTKAGAHGAVARKAPLADEALSIDYDATLAEEGVGLGIASRIAAEGLVQNPKLLKYVNLLATLLVESSGAYDTPIRVYVTKGDAINAVSIPGGHIFISKKMIDMCNDEAELAAVLAHEFMHILYKHGLKEIHQRLSNIRMDEAMAELDNELGEQPGAGIEELEDFAIEAYETVNKPRLLSYEVEADRGAAFLLAKTGYDPMAVGRMLLSMREIVGRSSDIDKEDPFLRRDMQRRYDKVVATIQKSLGDVGGIRNAERFKENVGR